MSARVKSSLCMLRSLLSTCFSSYNDNNTYAAVIAREVIFQNAAQKEFVNASKILI